MAHYVLTRDCFVGGTRYIPGDLVEIDPLTLGDFAEAGPVEVSPGDYADLVLEANRERNAAPSFRNGISLLIREAAQRRAVIGAPA